MKMVLKLALMLTVLYFSTASISFAADWCSEYGKSYDLDKQIAACTDDINSGKYTGWDNRGINRLSTRYGNRCNAYSGKKQYDQAIADCNKAIELDPKLAALYLNRGNAYKGKKHYDQAIADYNKAIELDPKFALAYINRGRTYSGKKQYDQAIADCNKAIELDPKYALAYAERGDAYYYKKQYDQAIADYNRAIELDPKDASSYYSIACIYSITGKSAYACEWLKRSIDVGFNEWAHLKQDTDFDKIRNTSCYKELMAGK